MDATNLYHVDRERPWRLGDEMGVDEHQRWLVSNFGSVVNFRVGIHHPDIGQPRDDFDVGGQGRVVEPLRQAVERRALVQQVRHVRGAGLRAEEQHLQGSDHGRRDGVDFGHAQPVRQVRQTRRVERLKQHQVERTVIAVRGDPQQ